MFKLTLEKSLKFAKDNITGISHFGASTGQEVAIYLKSNIKQINLFEPQDKPFQILKDKYENTKNINLFKFGLGSKDKVVELNIADFKNGESSSILNPKLHLDYHPDVKFNKKESIEIRRYDSLKSLEDNFLVIDIQGYEMEALTGCINKMSTIDFIYTEVNLVELYENSALIDDLDDFLKTYNFSRYRTHIDVWMMFGDALYVKNDYLNKMQKTSIKIKKLFENQKFVLYIKRLFSFKNYKKVIKKIIKNEKI